MNTRNTWAWLLTGAVLFTFIYLHEWRGHSPHESPNRILSRLKPAAVTLVQVRPSGPPQLEIRAERTNRTWRLTQTTQPNRPPLVYPAEDGKIENLLEARSRLPPGVVMSAAALR